MPETRLPIEESRYREGAGIGFLGGLAVSAAVLIPGFRDSGLNIGTGLETITFGMLTVMTTAVGTNIGEGIRRNR